MRSNTNTTKKAVGHDKGSTAFLNIKKYPLSVFDDVNNIEDVVKNAKYIPFADEKYRKSGVPYLTTAYMDEDNNSTMAIKITDGKNIDPEIQSEVFRNMRVISVGSPNLSNSLFEIVADI